MKVLYTIHIIKLLSSMKSAFLFLFIF